ncbi:MAG TPA: DUF930 domain-containing protein [Pseudolabrys sp.]|jgi:hypothetical protein
MRAFGWAIGLSLLVAAQATAAENRFERSLQMLAPAERLEQLCDYTAMARIRKDAGNFQPDRAVANATAEPVITNDTIDTAGGAFRSRGKWYALAFTCKATPDHMAVVSFNYKIGPEIPEGKWVSDGASD